MWMSQSFPHARIVFSDSVMFRSLSFASVTWLFHATNKTQWKKGRMLIQSGDKPVRSLFRWNVVASESCHRNSNWDSGVPFPFSVGIHGIDASNLSNRFRLGFWKKCRVCAECVWWTRWKRAIPHFRDQRGILSQLIQRHIMRFGVFGRLQIGDAISNRRFLNFPQRIRLMCITSVQFIVRCSRTFMWRFVQQITLALFGVVMMTTMLLRLLLFLHSMRWLSVRAWSNRWTWPWCNGRCRIRVSGT